MFHIKNKWTIPLSCLLKIFSIFMLCNASLGFAETPAKENTPKVQPLDDKSTSDKTSTVKKTDLDASEISMPSNLPRPLKIGVIFVLNDLYKISEASGNYEASIDLQFQWRDPSLAFDPKEYGTFRRELCLEQANKMLDKIWDPDIIIANINGKPISRDPCILIDAEGNVVYIQRIKAVFDSTFQLAPFPFDTQNLIVKLFSNRYNNTEIIFSQNQEQINQSGIRQGVSIAGWNVKNLELAYSNERGLDGKFFPQLEAKIIIDRQPISHLFAIAPLLLVVIVPTILTLYANVEISTRLTTWSGAILALIALSFTLNLRYPALPADSIMGQLIAIIFAYEFIMICLTMSIFNPQLTKQIKNPHLIPEIIHFMQWHVPPIIVAVVVIRILLTKLAA